MSEREREREEGKKKTKRGMRDGLRREGKEGTNQDKVTGLWIPHPTSNYRSYFKNLDHFGKFSNFFPFQNFLSLFSGCSIFSNV